MKIDLTMVKQQHNSSTRAASLRDLQAIEEKLQQVLSACDAQQNGAVAAVVVNHQGGATCPDQDAPIAKGGVQVPFPWKLHKMLDAVEEEGLTSIVSWQSHGRAFLVHNPKQFVDKVLTRFFSQSKYPSFQRQLNLYGFYRFAHGKDKGAYYHSHFLRANKNAVRGMVRRKIKGTKVRRTFAAADEPNFYDPSWNGVNEPVPVSPDAAKALVAKSSTAVAPHKCKHVPTTKAAAPAVTLEASSPLAQAIADIRARQGILMNKLNMVSEGEESLEATEASFTATAAPVITPAPVATNTMPTSDPWETLNELDELNETALVDFGGRPFHFLDDNMDQQQQQPNNACAAAAPMVVHTPVRRVSTESTTPTPTPFYGQQMSPFGLSQMDVVSV